MANTFIPLANAGNKVTVAKFATFNNAAIPAPVIPSPGTGGPNNKQTYLPVMPLPGIVGAGSYAI